MSWHIGLTGELARIDNTGHLNYHEPPSRLVPATPDEQARMGDLVDLRTCEYCGTVYRRTRDAMECERAAEEVLYPGGGS